MMSIIYLRDRDRLLAMLPLVLDAELDLDRDLDPLPDSLNEGRDLRMGAGLRTEDCTVGVLVSARPGDCIPTGGRLKRGAGFSFWWNSCWDNLEEKCKK